ncbi:helix-turn-helix domain-containing protein [uncultured Chitinophaga sp.]|jgi:Adenosine deaminase|uniref:AraC family transcriptional regulator n=1 Tax=uncultured Chitinophaga sp. TaxID=339340 RepID=UPI002628B6BE|nr:helix-turn-helix domain-containing protein [uncultured Chitinophaga sp.]
MQIAPPQILSDVVKHFLVLEQDEAVLRHHRLSPDGHAGIVCCYREPFAKSDEALLPRSFVYGQISRFHDLLSGVHTGMLVVVLQPYTLHLLTGIPAQELTDQLISMPLIFGPAWQDLEDSLIRAADHHVRLKLVIHFLIQQLQQRHAHADNMIRQALPLIYQSKGWMQITSLCTGLHISERQLERKFREQIGLSPKQFLRTIRFRQLLKALQQRPSPALTQLAFDAGYYDQPHFNREFRMLAGITPKAYQSARLLALNYIQLPA